MMQAAQYRFREYERTRRQLMSAFGFRGHPGAPRPCCASITRRSVVPQRRLIGYVGYRTDHLRSSRQGCEGFLDGS